MTLSDSDYLKNKKDSLNLSALDTGQIYLLASGLQTGTKQEVQGLCVTLMSG